MKKTVYVLGVGLCATSLRVINIYNDYEEALKEAQVFIDNGSTKEYIKILEFPLL